MIYVGAALGAAFFLLLWLMRRDTYKRGSQEEREKIAKDLIDAQRKQLDISSKPSRSLKSLLGSMRDNKL